MKLDQYNPNALDDWKMGFRPGMQMQIGYALMALSQDALEKGEQSTARSEQERAKP